MSTAGQDVVVVGAGAAGLAAAAALAGAGAKVTVLERRPYVGGRAYSYLHPALEEVVDSQHVLLGCCTNLISFCDAAGLGDKVRWYDRQTFLEAGHDGLPARASTIELSRLPAPMQYAGSFLRAQMLTTADKLAVARGLRGFARGNNGSDGESVARWYRRTKQTDGAIRHFWEPIVLATLNDSAENCSMQYAGKVFYELFLKTTTGGRLGIPTVPLSDFYEAGAELVRSLDGQVCLRSGVEAIEQEPDGSWLVTTESKSFSAKNVILALPFEQTAKLMGGLSATASDESMTALRSKMARFEHSPFLSVLLWFDREITDLHHAWLLDTTIQWFFHKSRIRGYDPGQGSYVEVVIAGSKKELALSREEILQAALAELKRFFPEAGRARLVKSGILKEARATFSVTPGLEAERPEQTTGIPGLYLAGDWTRTGWPSTMEGALRSGRLAAGAVVGNPLRFLDPELPASGIMQWLSRD